MRKVYIRVILIYFGLYFIMCVFFLFFFIATYATLQNGGGKNHGFLKNPYIRFDIPKRELREKTGCKACDVSICPLQTYCLGYRYQRRERDSR